MGRRYKVAKDKKTGRKYVKKVRTRQDPRIAFENMMYYRKCEREARWWSSVVFISFGVFEVLKYLGFISFSVGLFVLFAVANTIWWSWEWRRVRKQRQIEREVDGR